MHLQLLCLWLPEVCFKDKFSCLFLLLRGSCSPLPLPHDDVLPLSLLYRPFVLAFLLPNPLARTHIPHSAPPHQLTHTYNFFSPLPPLAAAPLGRLQTKRLFPSGILGSYHLPESVGHCTAAQAGTSYEGFSFEAEGDLPLPLGICSLVCNALVPRSVSAGLSVPALCLCLFFLWAELESVLPSCAASPFLSPAAVLCLPSLWGWNVGTAWWEAQQMQDINLSSSHGLFQVIVIEEQSGLKCNGFQNHLLWPKSVNSQ